MLRYVASSVTHPYNRPQAGQFRGHCFLRASSYFKCFCYRALPFTPRRALRYPERVQDVHCRHYSLPSFHGPPRIMSALLIQEVDAEHEVTPRKVILTPVESKLRDLLLDVAQYIKSNPDATTTSQVKLPDELAKQDLVLRFSGGWVRDKLLGVPSHDIDVSINKMTGYQFGLRLKEYLSVPGNLEKYGLEGVASTDPESQKTGGVSKSKLVGGLHKIEANPEKSKHLETVATRILGLDVDLVNLRKETYSDDSRNPQIEFGTAEEDARRRDATVNALFYNINTEQVEDFTQRGHIDMQNKLIRTPLQAYETFKDDPLRVLRLIRFASRLGYTIDEQARDAMRHPDIQQALQRKISRERVGIELEKALKGPDPHEALRLVFDLDLYYTIFSDPTAVEASQPRPDTAGWESVIDCLEQIIQSGDSITQLAIRNADELYWAWQLAAFVPYRNAPLPEPIAKKKRPPPVSAMIAREGIKSTNKVIELIAAAVENQAEISMVVDAVFERKRRPEKRPEKEDNCARDKLGMAIRKWDRTWRSQLVYSMLVEIADNVEGGSSAVAAIEKKYAAFLKHVLSLDLSDAYEFKPIIDGKALAKALGIPPGPWMTSALQTVMEWQLRNPGITDADEAISEVRRRRGELPSVLASHFLKLTIRPLFAKTKPRTVTETGRRVTTEVLPEKMSTAAIDENEAKPWKADHTYALTILEWSVNVLDEQLVKDLWPVLVPPILTLLDDWEIRYKIVGAQLLRKVLDKTTLDLLERTGLGTVFEQALLPCLTYVPTLTPEADSIPLLDSVYSALLSLSHTQYPKILRSSTKALAAVNERNRIKSLETMVRKGILFTYEYCSNYPHVLEVAFRHLGPVLHDLGIESIRHIKFLLPMLSNTLSQNALTANATERKTLLAATKALQAMMLNAWPRIHEYRGEVFKGLTLCWLNVDGVEEGSDDLQEELKRCVAILRDAQGKDSAADFEQECHRLIQAEEKLRRLLEP